MNELRIYETSVSSCNEITVSVGTTGIRGGDGGHGCKTIIRIEDDGGTCWDIVHGEGKNGQYINIELFGDSELGTIIEGLEYIVSKLKEHENDK